MRMTTWMAIAIIAAAVGCGSSSNGGNSSSGDGGTTNGDAGTPTPAGPEQLTAFARNLIETMTSDDSMPAEIASLTFAEDDEDPNTFAPEFFQ